MDAALAAFTFTEPKIERAARRPSSSAIAAASTPHRASATTSGMEVHDVTVRAETLEPGRLFTIEPAISCPTISLAFRLEDVILVTETGYENLSAFVPTEIDAIERPDARARARRRPQLEAVAAERPPPEQGALD